MGRKQFRQDLLHTINCPPLRISAVELSDDSEISFRFHYLQSQFSQHAIDVKLLALNVDQYPDDNRYMLFTHDNEPDPLIVRTFESLPSVLDGKTILIALEEISVRFHQVITSGQASNPISLDTSSDLDDEGYDGDDMDDVDDIDDVDGLSEGDDDDYFDFSQSRKTENVALGNKKPVLLAASSSHKVKADLRTAKAAGFKVGVFGDLTTAGVICISVRVAKLGISEDVMKSWQLEPSLYFVLLIRFQHGYMDAEVIKEQGILQGNTELRVGLCSTYKPSSESACDAFKQRNPDDTTKSQMNKQTTIDNFRPLFIGQPLNTLLKERFSTIIKLREIYSLSWCGAELLYNDTQGSGMANINFELYDKDDSQPHRLLPTLVKADSMSGKLLRDCSFPLLAMQFSLRHFVRCTEFCLVCHCRVEESFEALKPYVCARPLCLYQYMALGFGPSIEWEILSQPYVVDLLISFCYSQASNGRLRDFPTGINFRVPLLPYYETAFPNFARNRGQQTPTPTESPQAIAKSFSVRYNAANQELLFEPDQKAQVLTLHKGDYLTVLGRGVINGLIHHQVEQVIFPVVKLNRPVTAKEPGQFQDGAEAKLGDKWHDVDCFTFSHAFDDLKNEYKQRAILAMLDTLPPVKEMRSWLEQHGGSRDGSLRHWRSHILRPALDVLRWIIASNRSCIMQVDVVRREGGESDVSLAEDRVSGMDDYMQFRFAQGAPDKEQRFINSIQAHSATKPHPTIFAWHGSPIYNWHSIIREGLHFNDTLHGRAFGHGVYMSNMASTSVSYTSTGLSRSGDVLTGWPNSELQVAGALSLNEVVNDPTSFVSQSPHYVVAQTDWIQTRYLFVKSALNHVKETPKTKEIVQDSKYEAMGPTGGPVRIPISALPKSRRLLGGLSLKESKKRKSTGEEQSRELVIIEDDLESVMTTQDDRDCLLDQKALDCDLYDNDVKDSDIDMDDDMEMEPTPRKKQRADSDTLALELEVINGCLIDRKKTRFVPGFVDMSNVQKLPPPEDASRAATSALMKAFQALVKSQAITPAHDLGWYINPELDNVYQWIVELHSFDKDIPLANDMAVAGVASVVIEMRFTNQFPFAPPFVRVIKPRFVPFLQGGGGHVTDGGAICMELLTNDGWSAVSSIESVLLQIRLAMSEKERPARLPSGLYGSSIHSTTVKRGGSDRETYSVSEAMAAYERACRAHGWTVPDAFKNLIRPDER